MISLLHFGKGENYRDRKQISGFQEHRVEGGN